MTHFTFAHRVFVIRPWPALACAVVIATTLAAAQWQTARARYKQGLVDAYELSQKRPSQDVSNWGSDSPPEFSRASLQGEWKPGALIFADNQVRAGQVGYSVYMPLCQTDMRCVLVDRGWVKAGARRADLPDVVSPSGMQRVEGVVLRAQSKFVELSEQSVEGRVWQNVTVDRVSRASGLELAPFILAQSDAGDDGLRRDVIKPEFGVEKHIAYAAQWYAFALVTAISGLFAAMRKTGEKS
jgi:surfeit locus 1 family protein